MNTQEIIENLKKTHGVEFHNGDVYVSGKVGIGYVDWEDTTWSYGLYDSVNGIKQEGCYFFVIIDRGIFNERIYGWRNSSAVEDGFRLSEVNEDMSLVIVYDNINSLIKLKLKI